MKVFKKLIATLALLISIILTMVSPQYGTPNIVSAATIKISTKSCTIVKGKSKTLSISVTKKRNLLVK